ncbi:farnesyl-diphosphate farnesyl transferase [Niveomyces insectorum RCEF 264]|uniref:Squalene synthase n=1 Tax=Niveomyces insectorum RCEF 264 TaxID=1081102 RepID=A0A167Y7C2_9HYPO|nr:farnesyl-diphosphate farnesyl transferase [Niveomyces insectorum RCEF 264]
MPSAKYLAYLLVHPNELRSIIQWKMWHDPVHVRDPSKESPSEQACYKYLTLTSRSFAAVIQELNPELLMPVCLFYLVLRGLDTIEDDMTIPIAKKEPLLRTFHTLMEQDGWTFDENGPNEKDRDLLVHFDQIIIELKRMKPAYYAIVRDITIKMGNGMADYAVRTDADPDAGVDTVADYEQYCHYVAGLVGDGLTRLFVEGKLANPQLLARPDLTESMGQFLQKTNIVRDVHEDWRDHRRFWPQEIWSKHVAKWEDLFDPAHRAAAVRCSSDMVLNALKHADECLFYMAGIRDQSVFNFVAIPQSMAIATLELVFNNPRLFDSHLKITRGNACQLMTESTQNLRVVCDVFRRYARRIHKKNDPRDPNFTAISIQCGKIEQFIESIFPTQDIKKIQAGKKTEEPAVPLTDGLMLVACVVAMLLVVGGIMVGAAWFLGAHMDKILEGFGLAGPGSTPLAEGTAGVVHEEL